MSETTHQAQSVRERAHQEAVARRKKLFQDEELHNNDPWDKGYALGYTQGLQDGAQWHADQQPSVDDIAHAIRRAPGLTGSVNALALAEVIHSSFEK